MNKAALRRKKSDAKYLLREPELISRLSSYEKKMMYLYRDFCQNTDINDLDGEIWYDIPEWEGYYQLSNFIRLKSIRYNEIRKPRLNYKHYFDTSFHKNGNVKYLIYSRLVAIVFHDNTNNLPEVNHKNGIRWDNRPSNLEWSTSKDNTDHAITVLGNDRGERKIVQLSLSGYFIKYWDSISQAATFLGKSAANIVTTCQNKIHYSYGFIWMYKDDYELNGIINRHIDNPNKSVVQYDRNGIKIKEWVTMRDAAVYNNLRWNQIYNCCKNTALSAGGYKWSFNSVK